MKKLVLKTALDKIGSKLRLLFSWSKLALYSSWVILKRNMSVTFRSPGICIITGWSTIVHIRAYAVLLELWCMSYLKNNVLLIRTLMLLRTRHSSSVFKSSLLRWMIVQYCCNSEKKKCAYGSLRRLWLDDDSLIVISMSPNIDLLSINSETTISSIFQYLQVWNSRDNKFEG